MTDGELVIDASVLAKIYLRDEEFAPIAEAVVDRYVGGLLELVAPQYILYEIPNAIHRAVRRRRLDPSDARLAIRHFFNLGIHTLGDGATLPTMIQLAYLRARQLGCRMYDALYLVPLQLFSALSMLLVLTLPHPGLRPPLSLVDEGEGPGVREQLQTAARQLAISVGED